MKLKGTFVQFAIATLVLIGLHGWYFFGPDILYLLFLTYIISTVAELLSLKTSLRCFGVKYWYHLDQPLFSSRIRILKVYPLEVSLAWVILKYLSFNLAMLITQAFLLPNMVVVFLTPLILVSLDFIIDPVAVNVSKLWQWEKRGKYFGIPLQNFVGWYVVGFLSTFLFSFVYRERQLTFNIFYLLPIIFYASFIKNSWLIYKLNRKLALIGSIPAATWTLLSLISLAILYGR